MAQYKDGTYMVKDGEIYKIDIKVKWPIDGITVPLSDFIKQTNADRIRSMSDEELAEWLSNALNENSVSEGLCPQTIEFSRNCYKNNTDCNDKICIMAWLKQDANNA